MAPKFQSDELICKDAPTGQLAYTTPADVVAERIRLGDEAGEDCRQKLARAKMKIEVTNEIVETMNAKNKEESE